LTLRGFSTGDDDAMTSTLNPRTPSDQSDAKLARLLAHHWDLFTPEEREAALLVAYAFGAEFAEVAHEDRETAFGDAKDYRRVCVRWAYEDVRVVNDVERELWRSQDDDPRVLWFGRGFEARRRELRRDDPRW
jgi:hypothetical protein